MLFDHGLVSSQFVPLFGRLASSKQQEQQQQAVKKSLRPHRGSQPASK